MQKSERLKIGPIKCIIYTETLYITTLIWFNDSS